MLWSSIKLSLLYYNSLRKCMEIDLENLYVDVRAKKIKDHCHLATHSKLAFLWKKITVWLAKVQLGSDKRTSVFEIPGTSLLFSEVLAYCKVYVCTDCFCPTWPITKDTRTNENCTFFLRIFALIFSA